MSFTRFHDDPCRIKKQLQETTDPGRYILDTPGNGEKPCFMQDPFIRMQKWGANLHTNTINLESALLGMNNNLTRDCIAGQNKLPSNEAIQYPSCQPFTDQTRYTNPAWTARDLEQNNFQFLPLNPQENTCVPFHYNVNTRLVEKDNFIPEVPCIAPTKETSLHAQPFVGLSSASKNCTVAGTCGNL